MSILIDQSEKALEYALKLGADEAEVIVSKANILTINIENGDTRFGGEDNHKGLGIRIARNNSLGFAYTTVLTDHSLFELVDRAWKVS